MPAKKKTREDRMFDAFSKLYCVGKARSGMTDEEVADALGIGRKALWRRRKNPSLFPFGDILKLCALFCWEDDEVMKIVGLYCVNGGD